MNQDELVDVNDSALPKPPELFVCTTCGGSVDVEVLNLASAKLVCTNPDCQQEQVYGD
jgi:hypothetical protein